MSKRGNIKEDMELKKILVTLFFIFFTKILSAEIVNPNEKLLPYDVVKIQLEALKIIMKMMTVLSKHGYLLILKIKKVLVLTQDLGL